MTDAATKYRTKMELIQAFARRWADRGRPVRVALEVAVRRAKAVVETPATPVSR